MRYLPWLLPLALLCGVAAARADDNPLRYNQVSLTAEASEQVGNDTMHVMLNTYGEDSDATRLAGKINQDMAWALSVVKPHPDIRAATGSYQTWPLTDKDGRITTGWRGQQTLELESLNSEQLGRVVGELQQRLRITGMNFKISERKRSEVEDRLIDSALNAFKARAKRAATNLGAGNFRIVSIDIGRSAQSPPVLYRPRLAMAAAEAKPVVPVATGESEVAVTVSGTIELVLP
jgi:predicted secreted protein